MNLQFHQIVRTPNGPGIIQGRILRRLSDGSTQERVIVSHRKTLPAYPAENRLTSGQIKGIWDLYHYDPQELTPL